MADSKDKTSLADALPTDALKDAGQRLLGLLVQRAAEAATDRVSGLSERLGGVAENGGQGLRTALTGRERDKDDKGDDDDNDKGDDGDGESRPGFLKRGFGALKDKMKSAFGGGGGGSGGKKKLKVTVISESQDISLPLRTTYDLWTQFADFPTFMKKVESVEQASDEKMNWKAQIFLSHRTWEATVIEQVPDSHIVWRSKGPKGHVDGGVSFTSMGPNLTHVALILEYYPQGLFERTGNIWRAQGRRARLEFQHFRRHAMSRVLIHQEDVEGWRGEIRDSEVVKTQEEALEEEERARELEEGDEEDTEREGTDEEDTEREGTDEEAAEEQPSEGEEEGAEEEGAEEEGAEEEGADEEGADEEGAEEAAEEEPYDEDEEPYEEEDEYEDEGDEDVEDEDEDSGDRVDETREPATASRSRRGR